MTPGITSCRVPAEPILSRDPRERLDRDSSATCQSPLPMKHKVYQKTGVLPAARRVDLGRAVADAPRFLLLGHEPPGMFLNATMKSLLAYR
jgi:hypothetical protein